MSQRRMQRLQRQTMILAVVHRRVKHHQAAANLLTRASSATGATKGLLRRPQDLLHWSEDLLHWSEGRWIAPLLRRTSIPLGCCSCTAPSPSIIAGTASSWAAEVATWSMAQVTCRKQVLLLLLLLPLTFQRIFVVPAFRACPSAPRGAWPAARGLWPTWPIDRRSHRSRSTTKVSR